MSKLWRKFDHELAWLAAEKCLRDKWRRGDVRTFIEEWTGHSRYELMEDEHRRGQLGCGLKYQIIDEVAMVVEDMVDGIMRGEDPELDPVTVRPRKDGGTGKIRDIATLGYRHQLIGHAVKIGIEGLLRARIEPTQHASIPGRGQTGLARQVHRMLRRRMGIKFYQKIDGRHAYASIQYDAVRRILRREIPRAAWVHGCMRVLARAAPEGCLIIGGYLDAWLFNFVMGYAVRYVTGLSRSRRGNRAPLIIRAVTFMDDAVLMARSESGLRQAVRKLSAWMADQYGMMSRTTSGIIRILTARRERARKALRGARRGVPAVDAGGFRIFRTGITIRKRNVPRIIRCFVRAREEIRQAGTIRRQRACLVISRYGMVVCSRSWMLREKYGTKEIMTVARRVQAYWSRVGARRRKENVKNAVERYAKQRAALCCGHG